MKYKNYLIKILLFLSSLLVMYWIGSTHKEGMDNFHMDEFLRLNDLKTHPTTHPTLLNLYGEPLVPCRESGSNDESGSWNERGFCDEMGGGVHQICLSVNKVPKFSESTGQGPWSEGRRGRNHCMCLGAWALYKAKQERGDIPKTYNELQCESIMDDALDSKYVSKWNTWNGHELPNQIVQGVNKLKEQCYKQAKTKKQKEYLLDLYQTLTSNKPEFNQ